MPIALDGIRTCTSGIFRPSCTLFSSCFLVSKPGLEKSAAIRPFATKKSRLASKKILLVDSLATESCGLADRLVTKLLGRLATKLFFKADNTEAGRT